MQNTIGAPATASRRDGPREYTEVIQDLIRLRSVEYMVVTHGYPYRDDLRRKIREASLEADRAQQRFLNEAGGGRTPLAEDERRQLAREAERDFTPEEVAALRHIRACLEAAAHRDVSARAFSAGAH